MKRSSSAPQGALPTQVGCPDVAVQQEGRTGGLRLRWTLASTATATVPRPHTRCAKLPGHKERNPKIPLRQLKSYELKYSTVPCQASECPSELNPRADAVGGKALGFPSGSVCGDGSGSREKGRWPARKTTRQPGRPGPTAPGSTLVSAWQTRPSASHNPGEGRRAWGTATCNSRPTVGGREAPQDQLRTPQSRGLGQKSARCRVPSHTPGIAGTGAHVCPTGAPSSRGLLSPRVERDSRKKNRVLHRECNIFQKILQGRQAVPWLSTSDWHSCVLQTARREHRRDARVLAALGPGTRGQAQTFPGESSPSHYAAAPAKATPWPGGLGSRQ